GRAERSAAGERPEVPAGRRIVVLPAAVRHRTEDQGLLRGAPRGAEGSPGRAGPAGGGRHGAGGRPGISPKTAPDKSGQTGSGRTEEHTSELQSRENIVCRLLLEKKKK